MVIVGTMNFVPFLDIGTKFDKVPVITTTALTPGTLVVIRAKIVKLKGGIQMSGFTLQRPKVLSGIDIEKESMLYIERECGKYPKYETFKENQQSIIRRLIHTTSLFDQVLNNIYFTDGFVDRSMDLLKNGASIIVDTNMIKSGVSRYYTDKYNNDVICYVSDEKIINEAKEKGVTRTYLAVQKSIMENVGSPMILACGNAPTFIYSMIETIVNEKLNTDDMSIIAYPVGFINVAESKDYLIDFAKHYNAECSVMRGNYGASTMVVASLHAMYKLI